MSRYLIVGVLLSGACTALAQIRVACELPHEVYVPFEPVVASVTLINDTGSAIPLGSQSGAIRIRMDMTDVYGNALSRISHKGLTAPDTLPAYTSVVIQASLQRMYDLTARGEYSVTAKAEWGDSSFASPKRFFDIIPGVELKRAKVPLADGLGSRTYMLITINRARGDQLLVRVDDEEQSLCYGVVNLGRILNRRKPPIIKVDGLGQCHLLFQRAPGQYAYAVCGPDAVLMKQDDLASDYQDARLEIDDSGDVVVLGIPMPEPPPVYRGNLEDTPVRRPPP